MILSEKDINRIIEMSWEDRTPFDAIFMQFNLRKDQVKELMKKELKFSSFGCASDSWYPLICIL